MAKEDKKKFQLNKSSDHNFDISKGNKRKFDLTKDEDDKEVVVKTAPQANQIPVESSLPPKDMAQEPKTENVEEKKGKNWIWIIVAIIIILLLIWLFLPKNGSDADSEGQQTPITEQSDEIIPSSNDASEENRNDAVNEESKQASEDEFAIEDKSSEVVVAENEPLQDNTPVTQSVKTATPSHVSSNVSVTSDIEAEALKVIRGDYGVGQQRKEQLGSQYSAIQARVNEMKNQGLF